MTINYKKKNIEIYDVESFTCDVCKKKYSDVMETQEFHKIDFIGRYGSVFGDENLIMCDICQYCLHGMIKDYMRIT